MKKLFTTIGFIVLGISISAQLPIISQYYEGAGYDKWIEVNNPTSSDIDLSGYYVCNFNSDTDSPTACVQLSGTIAPFNSYLVSNPDASEPAYATADVEGGCNFNGNDKVVITTSNSGAACYDDRIDEIGGTAGGSNWGQDKSFYRNPGINEPSITYSSSDWTEVSIATVDGASSGTYEYLGWHNVDVLPIEISKFSAEKINNNVQVSWSTLSEENNDYFVVEWSRDGIDFEEIAKVDGAGTSRELQEYSYTHTNPSNGVNYYRLTQYDLDGRSETYNVVSVTFDSKSKEMFIVPNKVDNSLNIEFSQTVENGRLHIFDMSGKRVQSFVIAKGVITARFDISNLVSGQYIVKYIDTQSNSTKRFIKL